MSGVDMLAATSVVAWIALGVSSLSLIVMGLNYLLNLRRHREEKPKLILVGRSSQSGEQGDRSVMSLTLNNQGGSDVMVQFVGYTLQSPNVSWTQPVALTEGPEGQIVQPRGIIKWEAVTECYAMQPGAVAKVRVFVVPAFGKPVSDEFQMKPPYRPNLDGPSGPILGQ